MNIPMWEGRPPRELSRHSAEFQTRRPPRVPLADDEVLDIYRASGTHQEIGDRFNVDRRTVYGIKNHENHTQLLEEFA
jgi:DNA invertase Pin-like site-specific DNA recombinase